MTLRESARSIFDAALAAGDVRPLVARALAGIARPAQGRVLVVGAGKASGAMAAAVETAWGDLITDGVVAVKDGHTVPTRTVRLLEAGHPVPDERGAAAARQIHALAESAGADDLVLVLVSGGGSALTPAPVPPITLADKQALTRLLLAAGATINQLNAVRKHCSLLKGGQLARAAAPARVEALLLSDVVGDPLDVIASGPTTPDVSTFAEALAILDRFGPRGRAPRAIVERLERGARGEVPETPKPGDPIFTRVANHVIGNNALVVDAAAAKARALGFTPHVLTRAFEGEAREAGARFVDLARAIQAGRGPVAAPACIIAGGETTVTIEGAGKGGRCQELALAAALAMSGMRDVVVLAAGTDGTDGPTDAAGGIVDGDSAARARARGVNPEARLAENDSNPVLAAAGDLVTTGPTNTNLLDLYLGLVGLP
ncbi:MAG TPA: glycerate kinase [Candidatus Bathyarchaeia archaeon]|nr:glycerate kinase [Candidatus Bathyarchaeia archaeon]